MAWRIEIADSADKQLGKLDRQVRERILTFLRDRLAPLDTPRAVGEALKGPGHLWKYRVGDWRIIADIQDAVVTVVVVRVGNRREVYRR